MEMILIILLAVAVVGMSLIVWKDRIWKLDADVSDAPYKIEYSPHIKLTPEPVVSPTEPIKKKRGRPLGSKNKPKFKPKKRKYTKRSVYWAKKIRAPRGKYFTKKMMGSLL